MDLTPENWENETSGKTIFVKFFAPWCGHCKIMKPAWDKLMKNWNKGDRAKTSLVADVDCTAEGKPLCEEHGVKGFPSIKWGDPSRLEDYEGGRDYDALKKFAKENLKPVCSPTNIDLCDADKKKEIADIESNFEAEVKKLQETYGKLQEDKDSKIADIESNFEAEVKKLQE